MNKKVIIYQIFTRLFGNRNTSCKKDGTIAENGVGKMNDLDVVRLRKIHDMGFTHVCTRVSFVMPRQQTIRDMASRVNTLAW